MRCALTLLLLVVASCQRTPESSAGPPAGPALSAAPGDARSTPQTTIAPREWRHPAARRVAAIGDLHGDFEALRAVLRLAGATNAEDDWVGGELVVVQTGDVLDRGDGERKMLDLLRALEPKAQAAHGALHVLNGNHEIMNVMGDFRYVTPGGFGAFADVSVGAPSAARATGEARGRSAAFFPGGPYARQLAEHDVVIAVGDTLFVHGGALPDHVRYGLGRLDAEVGAWMRGDAPAPALAQGEDSPVWSRRYSEGEPDAAACKALGEALSLAGAARMVVGHTVQKDGITSGCDGRVWRIDVGLARPYGGKPALLMIENGKPRALIAPSAG